ncbi:alpha/beta hydrolase [Comamonas guangdongensis]|uniref:Alpha/beta hydrolase n=1 Tax=Comamonas guangdongensis TaxID=510515 RepID=A0ABV4A0S2_9BURK
MPQTSYKAKTYWMQYQSFFPAHARVTVANGPNEEWLPWRGASIHVDRFPCVASPLTVIVVHGGGGYGRLFAPIGKLLYDAGYEVVAPDLPGYGLSQAPASLVTYEAWTDLLCDMAAIEYRNTGRRVVLCGGSLGGYLAYLCAARMGGGPIAGVIATTLADPRTPLVKRQFARNALVRHVMLPLLPFCAALIGRLRLPVKWFTKMGAMSNDPLLNRLVAEDPYGGGVRVPVSFMQSIFAARPDMEPEDFDLCPLLLAHPENDRWADFESSRQFFDRIKGEKRLVMLENCGHFPVEAPGLAQLEQASIRFLQQIARVTA